MASIISCSRRTDVPAFYTPWLMNRLREGFCHTLNPFGGQVYRVSLKAEDVIALTFWTRYPQPMWAHLHTLEAGSYKFFFSQTITGYPDCFEPHSPPLEQAVRTFRAFADRLSPLQMRWRYDPIVLSSVTPVDFHIRQFETIAAALEGATTHCTFSFVQFYGKTTRNVYASASKAGVRIERPGFELQQELAQQLAGIAAQHGMSLNTCCDDRLIGEGVTKSRCIDPELIGTLAPAYADSLNLKPTRPQCGCAASVDIGAYDTCRFDCAYCYATNNPQIARARHGGHDPSDSLLYRPEQLSGVDLDTIRRTLKTG